MRLTTRQQLILSGALRDLTHYTALTPRFEPGDLRLVAERVRIDDATHGIVRTDPAAWLHKALTPSEYVMLCRDYRRLESLGLIERLAFGMDGARQTHIRLTDAGRELAEKFEAQEAPADG
jgi:hypothetical protein